MNNKMNMRCIVALCNARENSCISIVIGCQNFLNQFASFTYSCTLFILHISVIEFMRLLSYNSFQFLRHSITFTFSYDLVYRTWILFSDLQKGFSRIT